MTGSKSLSVLMLDNFDSFTYNLVDFFRQLGCEVNVYRNTVDPETLAQLEFDLLVLSPGPSLPVHAGNMMRIIKRFYLEKPILGVCLGHQALIEFFGGSIANIAPVHGKAVTLQHDGRGIFSGLEQDCEVARYHSWAGDIIPSEFEISARSADGVIMGVRHKRLPIEGIQFHPESVLSMKNQAGMRMLRNVVEGRMAAGNRIYHQLSKVLQTGAVLEKELYRSFLNAIQEGQLSEDQKQILLVSLSHRLRNAQELAHFIAVLMGFTSSTVAVVHPAPIDICGTGGSGLPRINTSTLATLLLAQSGLKIAKHGNRAVIGRYGSFNLLENLGIPPQFDPEKAKESLEKSNLAFIYAPDVHPIFRHFASMRAKIGVPTVFNVLGPLVNPYLPERQFIGTAFADLMDVIFECGIQMGKKHLIVARGWDGLDEISISTPTRILEYRDGKKQDYEINPQDFGLEPVPFSELSAANPDECLKIARDMMAGHTKTAHYKLVVANAAFIYAKFVEDIPLPIAFRKMEKQLQEGGMLQMLERYKQCLSETTQSA